MSGGRLAETWRVYRTVVANRSLRRVLGAFLAFNAQENGVWIAIVVYAYERGGASTAGLVAIAQLIPSALVAPIGSWPPEPCCSEPSVTRCSPACSASRKR